ncbi:MAG: hypothetical protein WD004_08345 [Actinomycetota bacterium]
MLKRWLVARVVLVTGVVFGASWFIPAIASAQNPIDPTAEIEVNDGGWIFWIDWLVLGLSVLLCLLLIFGYMKLSPRFRRAEADEPAVLRPGVKAPKVQLGAVAPRPPAPPRQVEAVAAAPPPAAPAVSPAAASAAPAPAVAAATPPAAAAEPTPAAPEAAATSPAGPEEKQEEKPGGKPEENQQEKPEAELDQETFDRVLQEQLDKGVDRRVAEGRAKSAAIQAGRKKAGG